MAACLESIFREIGVPLTQQEMLDRVSGAGRAAPDEAVWSNLNQLLEEHGFVGKLIDTTCTHADSRLANFRQLVARYRGIYAILFTRPRRGKGRIHCVRLLGTTPLLRVMNPAGGAIETWSDGEVLERNIQLYLVIPVEYAAAYPEGGPTPPDAPPPPPAVTKLPPPAPEYPDEIKAGIVKSVQEALSRQPPAAPRVNPVTGLVIPSLLELTEQIIWENLFQQVDRQLRDPQTPAIRQAYDRMIVGGFPIEHARELITCIYAACILRARANGQPVNPNHYIRELMTVTGADWPV
jgi:hypothetical protein